MSNARMLEVGHNGILLEVLSPAGLHFESGKNPSSIATLSSPDLSTRLTFSSRLQLYEKFADYEALRTAKAAWYSPSLEQLKLHIWKVVLT